MPRVYFDTNVYDRIDKGCVSPSDVDALRLALRRGNLTANISIVDIEELLGEWETNRPAAVSKLKTARELIGFDEILNQPSELLRDTIRAYAAGEPAPSPLLPLRQRGIVANQLHRVANGDAGLDSVISNSIAEIRTMKEGFREALAQGREEVLPVWEKIVAKVGRNSTFEEYWAAGARDFAEGLVPPDYIGACRARGSEGLLEVRTMRLAVGTLMSLIFSQVVGDGLQSRKPHLGDAYDLWHAILASVADVFVTYDGRLAGLLRRVPIGNFQIFASIPELLRSDTDANRTSR